MQRWQDDAEFMRFLRGQEYVGRGDALVMSIGTYLYMYEAWVASRAHAEAPRRRAVVIGKGPG